MSRVFSRRIARPLHSVADPLYGFVMPPGQRRRDKFGPTFARCVTKLEKKGFSTAAAFRICFSVGAGGAGKAGAAKRGKSTGDSMDTTAEVARYTALKEEGAAPAAPAVVEIVDDFGGALDLSEAKVAKDSRIVKGVVLIGPESPTRRRIYPRATLEAALPLYDGVKIYEDHPDYPGARKVRELIGRVVKGSPVLTSDGKIKADIRAFKRRPGDDFLAIAEDDPTAVGMSHNALGIEKPSQDREGWSVITEIVSVRSVDVVTEPGTTKGLHESEGTTLGEFILSACASQGVTLGELAEAIDVEEDVIRDIARGHTVRPPDDQLRGIAHRLGVAFESLKRRAVGAMKPQTKGDDMDLTKLTLAELIAARSDLVEEIKEQGRAEIRDGDLKTVTEERDALKIRAGQADAAKLLAEEMKKAENAGMPEKAVKRCEEILTAAVESGLEVDAKRVAEVVADHRDLLESAGWKPEAEDKSKKPPKSLTDGAGEFGGEESNDEAKKIVEETVNAFGELLGVAPDEKKE